MSNTNIKKLIYKIRYVYPVRELGFIVVMGIVTIAFIWGSISTMQKNYVLRAEIEEKYRQKELLSLQKDMLEYEQAYLRSEEYLKLAAREKLGYGDPGEKLLRLPANTEEAKQADAKLDEEIAPVQQRVRKDTNFRLWMNFLFGGNADVETGAL